MRWLHISDLHVGSDKYASDIVLGALVRAFADGGGLASRRPDVIFCTGDLAYSGKAGEYERLDVFFTELSAAAGVPRERIFVVPGNHDLDRGAAAKGLVRELRRREELDEIFDPADPSVLDLWLRPFRAFADFEQRQLGRALSAAQPYLSCRTAVGDRELLVVGLNTAWLALDDGVKGKLVASERVLRRAMEEIPLLPSPRRLRVALLHHPFGWLVEFEEHVIEALLLERFYFVLVGHGHRQRPREVRIPEGEAAVLAVGASYEGRDRRNCALLVEVDEKASRVEAIIYRDDGSGLWTLDGAFCAGKPVFVIPRRTDAPGPPGASSIGAAIQLAHDGAHEPASALAQAVESGLEKRHREAAELLNRGRYEQATAILTDIEQQAMALAEADPAHAPSMLRWVARSRLNRAAALLNLQEPDQARALFAQVEPDLLSLKGRFQLVECLVLLREIDRARDLLGAQPIDETALSDEERKGLRAARQRLAIAAGELPAELDASPDVLPQAASALLAQGDLARAARHGLHVLGRKDSVPLVEAFAVTSLIAALHGTVIEEPFGGSFIPAGDLDPGRATTADCSRAHVRASRAPGPWSIRAVRVLAGARFGGVARRLRVPALDRAAGADDPGIRAGQGGGRRTRGRPRRQNACHVRPGPGRGMDPRGQGAGA
ncbi:MAG: metallophosphoesterase [Deltaproteobacteria bacterium]|nr:metallophosphoesterase [Deltaproteobacteria bacterium]